MMADRTPLPVPLSSELKKPASSIGTANVATTTSEANIETTGNRISSRSWRSTAKLALTSAQLLDIRANMPPPCL